MEALPILLIVIAATTLFFLIKKYSSRSDSKHHKKDSVSTKVNIVVGGTPPPGGITFKPDGTIERVPDSLAARHKWTVQKMTRKIEQEPDDDEWYFERGKALMELRQYQEAIPDFSKIIEKYPTFGGYYEFRGLCYLHAGEKANALADFQRYNGLTNKEHLHESTIKILDKLEKELSRKNI